MKICLYLEFYNFLNGILYKKIGTGLLSSFQNQKKIIKHLNYEYTTKYDSSCDLLVINTPWPKSIYLIKKAKREKKKVFVWSHVTAEDAKNVFRFANFLNPLLKMYLKYAYNLADKVLCPSEYTKQLLINYGLPKEKLVVQSNGVDTSKFKKDDQKRNKYRQDFSLNTLTVGTVGLAIPRKGIKTFINLAQSFPKNKFIWYGKIYSNILVESIPKNLPSNMEFTGYVDDIVAAFNSLDIFVFPSFEENQGMVILEAASLGLPILLRDIPTYNGWLIHEKNCLKAKNEDEFNFYLKELINNQDLRESLGKEAKILADSEKYEILSEKLDNLIKESNT